MLVPLKQRDNFEVCYKAVPCHNSFLNIFLFSVSLIIRNYSLFDDNISSSTYVLQDTIDCHILSTHIYIRYSLVIYYISTEISSKLSVCYKCAIQLLMYVYVRRVEYEACTRAL